MAAVATFMATSDRFRSRNGGCGGRALDVGRKRAGSHEGGLFGGGKPLRLRVGPPSHRRPYLPTPLTWPWWVSSGGENSSR
jgi:hypothetical protein